MIFPAQWRGKFGGKAIESVLGLDSLLGNIFVDSVPERGTSLDIIVVEIELIAIKVVVSPHGLKRVLFKRAVQLGI